MIVIGASRGGSKALQTLLRGLPHPFPMPLAVVLHRHKEAGDLLPPFLQEGSQLAVSEVVDKEPIQPGHVYIAPPDYHLLVEPTHFSLSTDEPVSYARPSIDVLFESAADAFGPKVIGVVLTGSSPDGAHGAAQIKRCGGQIVIQAPETAEDPTMPLAAWKATRTPHVRSLDQIATVLIELAQAMLKTAP
ncbi:MAG: cheB, two-component system, chemotaxis family, response regulator CheB [Pedosphaera sp.]|nr:cheB, two-component system, chemotaxis family, response regulator CheB [Pedosphaera sp.]